MGTYQKILDLWKSYNISSVSDLDKYLDNFQVLFAYNSGKIENPNITYNDTREIFEQGKVTAYSGDTRTLFEQQNQKLCYEFLKDKIIAKEHISTDLICEMHRILTSGTYDERRYIVNDERPGEFKKHDYVTGINEVGSSADNVETELIELINEITEYTGDNILKVSAYFHASFESIHPFADGNGRVGRTLLNYYLMINNHPPLIIYDEDKKLYYECLAKYDVDEDINPLTKFLEYETEKTWNKMLSINDSASNNKKRLNDII